MVIGQKYENHQYLTKANIIDQYFNRIKFTEVMKMGISITARAAEVAERLRYGNNLNMYRKYTSYCQYTKRLTKTWQ